MAKGLIEIAIQLGSKLGANTSKFLGTRSNVSFMGPGPKDGMLFQKEIIPESFASIGIEKVIPDIESSLAYAAGGKLNDIELSTLIKNLKTMDETINPLPVANITDMATGTRNLDQEGLASLRLMSDDFGYIAPEEAAKLKELKNINVPSNLDSLRAKSGLGERQATDVVDPNSEIGRSLRMEGEGKKLADSMSESEIELRGNFPKATDVEIKNMLSNESPAFPSFKTTENIDSSSPLMSKIENRIGGMRDETEAATGIMKSVEKGDLPAKTGAAREFLVNSLKVGDDYPSTTLTDVMSAQDMKYIFEGGGGAMGDPLVLVQKYFGPRIAEMIPNGGTTEEIAIFTKKVMNNVEDAKGFRPDEPEFDAMTAMFVDNLAYGGRAGYAKGGLAKILEL